MPQAKAYGYKRLVILVFPTTGRRPVPLYFDLPAFQIIAAGDELLVVIVGLVVGEHHHVQLLAHHHQAAQDFQLLLQGGGSQAVDPVGKGILLGLHPGSFLRNWRAVPALH